MKKSLPIAVMAAVSAFSVGKVCSASEISINFEDAATTSALTSSSITAGAPGAAAFGSTWNNLDVASGGGNFSIGNNTSSGTISNNLGGSGTSTKYLYSYNGSTTATTSMVLSMFVHNGLAGTQEAGSPMTETSQDDVLYGMAQGSGAPNNAIYTLTGIPYASTGYSVYLYYTGVALGYTSSLSDGTTTYYFGDATTETNTTPFPGYLGEQATNSTNSNSFPTSVYAVFSGETSSTLTITYQGLSGGQIMLAGMQIVQTPEPATLGLLGTVGAMALLRRRRGNRL